MDRLTVAEELRFLDQTYARDGRTGLMLQTLLLKIISGEISPFD